MSNTPSRKYNYSDAILLAHFGKVLIQLPNDLPAIEAETGVIDQDFLDQLKADYERALEEGGDNLAKGKVGQKTQNLVDAMQASKKIVKRIRFYVAEAFEEDPATKKSFGLSQYWKIANSQPQLIKFMNTLAMVVSENKDALMDKGAKQALIDSVGENAKALAEADAIQESSKGGRSTATQARINALNSLYKRGLRLDLAADITFEDNLVKADFYNMPQPQPKVEDFEVDNEQV